MSTSSLKSNDEKLEDGDVLQEALPGEVSGNNEEAVVPSQSQLSSTQDGGSRAWLQVAGSFIVFANIWGLAFAFGMADVPS